MIDLLLIEDNADDAMLLNAELKKSGCDAAIRRVEDRDSFLRALEHPPQVVVADYRLPQYGAIEALSDLRERFELTPFIIFSGEIDEDVALKALSSGADDFVMKDRPRRLAAAIERALHRSEKLSKERRDAEAMRAMVDALHSLSEQRRSLLERLTSAQEDERRRIAGDVHDDHIQMMTAISLRIQLLNEDHSRFDVREELAEITDLLTQGITRLRRFIFDLYPDILVEEGLEVALGPYIESVAADFDLEIDLSIDSSGAPERQIEIVAFRILQEALTNVRKHAEACKVVIAGDLSPEGVRFLIEDDGCGLKGSEREGLSHIGIRTMRDRAELAGGFLEVGKASLGGARVEYWIPCGEIVGVSSHSHEDAD